MTQNIQLPNGDTLQFPDDMPDDAITKVIAENYPDLAPKAAAPRTLGGLPVRDPDAPAPAADPADQPRTLAGMPVKRPAAAEAPPLDEATNTDARQNQFAANRLSRRDYEKEIRTLNPRASQEFVDAALAKYDEQKEGALKADAAKRQAGPMKGVANSDDFFNDRLNKRLQAGNHGVARALPAHEQQDFSSTSSTHQPNPDDESALHAAGSYLGRSTTAGLYDLAGAGAKLLDSVNPFTLSDSDAAILFKGDPAKLKQMQDESAAMGLSRFAHAMQASSNEQMENVSPRAKRDYSSLEYATLDADKSALMHPVRVIGDAVRSMPSSMAMAASAYFTRGASLRAEQTALEAGLSAEAASAAGVQAAMKMMATTSASSEGAIGYAQQSLSSSDDASKIPMATLQKAPQFQRLLKQGYTPETARAQIIADIGEHAGQIGGLADAVTNQYGGAILGKIISEGGPFIRRVLMGAADESATEFVQSAGEQMGQNHATRLNADPDKPLMDGVGEAAIAGAAVGGLMGGTTAGVAGHQGGHVDEDELARVQAESADSRDRANAARDAALAGWNNNGLSPSARPGAGGRREPTWGEATGAAPAARREPSIADIGAATSVDDAIAAATAVAAAPAIMPNIPASPHATGADIDALEATHDQMIAEMQARAQESTGKRAAEMPPADLPAGPEAAPALGLSGKESEDPADWHAFPAEMRSLGVPRAQMPQILAEHRGAMVNFLNARGISHEQVTVPAESLRPTQREFSVSKVDRAGEYQGGNRSILISSDNYVLDGHHQWMAHALKGEPVQAIRLNAPIKQLVKTVHQFPSATVDTSSASAAPAPAEPGRPLSAYEQSQERIRKQEQIVNEAAQRQQERRGGVVNEPGSSVPKAAERDDPDLARRKDLIRERLRDGLKLSINTQGDGSVDVSAGMSAGDPIPIELTKEERKALKLARADYELADSHEEREAARTAEQVAIRTAVDRMLSGQASATERAPAAAPLPAPKPTAGQRSRERVARENPFLAFLAGHGLHIDERSDTGGQKGRAGNVIVPGFGGSLYRRSGKRLDELAQLAHEAGFLSDDDINDPTDNGGTRKLADMIERAVHSKEAIQPAGLLDAVAPTSDQRLIAEAERLGVDTEGKTADQLYDAVRAAHAGEDAKREASGASSHDEQDAIDHYDGQFSEEEARHIAQLLEDEQIPLDGGKPSNNLTDEEVDALFGIQAAGPRAAGGEDQTNSAGAAREGAAPGGETGQGEGQDLLTSYTAGDVLEREDAATSKAKAIQAERDKLEAKRKAEQDAKEARARADATVDDFQLGQDPMAQLSGQRGMFDEPVPAAKSEAEQDPVDDKPMGYYGDAEKPLRFASGMSAPKDYAGMFAAGGNVGITITELSDKSIPAIAKAMVDAPRAAHLFVDSGAFSVFRANMKASESGQMGFDDVMAEFEAGGKALDFGKILDRYHALESAISKADDRGYTNDRAFFVMPDVVGNQAESIALAKKYADDINGKGLRAIVPLQSGELSLTQAYEAVMRNLGMQPTDLSPVLGIPSNEAAASDEEFLELMKKYGDNIMGVHILGAAQEAKLQPRLDVLKEAGYDGNVSADANLLRSFMYGDTDRATAMRKAAAMVGAREQEIEKAKKGGKHEKATAPEHITEGVDDRELGEIVKEFNDAQADMMQDGHPITNVFAPPKKKEIVRLANKVRDTGKLWNEDESKAYRDDLVEVKSLTKKKQPVPAALTARIKAFEKDYLPFAERLAEEAAATVEEWKAKVRAQGKDQAKRSANSKKVVLSFFDLSGEWSKPWEEAGYEVHRFDIQADPVVGDVNNFSADFFGDWFDNFDGKDIHAILAATPCTDFASSGNKHFAAKDADGRTVASVKLVHQTLRAIEYFKPALWALENPVGRIEKLGGLPPWRLSFDPNHLGDDYTKKTLIWGRFNADLPIAPAEPTEGSKMWSQYGGKSMATKNARSETPEGFSYGFFLANNAIDHPALAIHGKYDRLDRGLIDKAVAAGITEDQISSAVDDHYYMDLDDDAANQAIRDLIAEAKDEAAPADTGADIPASFYSTVTVDYARLGANGKSTTEHLAADKALEQTREDISNLEALLKCMGHH